MGAWVNKLKTVFIFVLIVLLLLFVFQPAEMQDLAGKVVATIGS